MGVIHAASYRSRYNAHTAEFCFFSLLLLQEDSMFFDRLHGWFYCFMLFYLLGRIHFETYKVVLFLSLLAFLTCLYSHI